MPDQSSINSIPTIIGSKEPIETCKLRLDNTAKLYSYSFTRMHINVQYFVTSFTFMYVDSTFAACVACTYRELVLYCTCAGLHYTLQ